MRITRMIEEWKNSQLYYNNPRTSDEARRQHLHDSKGEDIHNSVQEQNREWKENELWKLLGAPYSPSKPS